MVNFIITTVLYCVCCVIFCTILSMPLLVEPDHQGGVVAELFGQVLSKRG